MMLLPDKRGDEGDAEHRQQEELRRTEAQNERLHDGERGGEEQRA